MIHAQRYFPLDLGNSWTYSNDRFSGETTNTVVGIDEFGVATVSIRVESNLVEFDEFGSTVDIYLPDDGPVLYYDFARDRWEHRDIDSCADRAAVTIRSRTETVTMPAGVFENCVRLEYGPGLCADAGIMVQYFAPGVGLVQWSEQNFAGPVTHSLVSFVNTSGIAFTRGDINQDGNEDISDAGFLLTYLFLGGSEPGCHRSADVNDDDAMEMADAVTLLTHLFLGGFPPAEPFPTCGWDRTPDENLTCESFPECADKPE